MESLGQQITIRIRENGSFSAGSRFTASNLKTYSTQIGAI